MFLFAAAPDYLFDSRAEYRDLRPGRELEMAVQVRLQDLTRALENDEIVPYFQPIVELITSRVAGFEILARWRHPEMGAILPSNLIPLAEANGLIGHLSNRLFAHAISQISALPGELRLSFNLSPIQMRHLTLPRQIEAMAREANFDLRRLTVEITESALLTDLPTSQQIANDLKDLGCCLSLDDFGTGYSSLAHLQALPFDEFKIDRSFVSRMVQHRESRKIVAATVGLGHSLGLKTVAEGIENVEQADILLWLGCQLGQGWLYGRPEPISAALAMATAAPQPHAPALLSPGDDWAVSNLEAYPMQRLSQLQAIYDGAPVGLCFLDRDLRYVNLNQRLADMNGAPISAHLGKTVKEMIPNLYSAYEPHLMHALTGEAIAGVEIMRPAARSDLEPWISLCSYQPAFDETDEVIGLSISVLNITEHHLAINLERDAALKESVDLGQERFMTDEERDRLEISSDWVMTVSTSRKAIRDLGWLEALHPDDLKPVIRGMRDALQNEKPIDIRYRVQNTAGEWRWMRSRGSPRYNSQGEIIRWYGSVTDVHEARVTELGKRMTRAPAQSKASLKGSHDTP